MTKTTSVKIEDVKLIEEYYPRKGVDDNTVKSYRAAIDKLPPVLIAKNSMVLIDGYHRFTAHQLEGRTEIDAILEDIPRKKILVEAAKLNVTHGKQLSIAEKKALARKFADDDEFTQQDIAEILSVSQPSVSKWISDISQRKANELKVRALLLYLDYINYPAQDDVSEELGIPRQRISRYISDVQNTTGGILRTPPDELQITTAWEFKLCDPTLGMPDYPGNIAGQLVENLLWYYTEPFDLVVDPMAGGGTTIDVCKKMFRRYVGYDINPLELRGIKYNDITEGIPLGDNVVDFVILDPPYWKQRREDYVDKPTELSHVSLDEFYNSIDKIASECHRILKKGKKVAFIISDMSNKEDGFVDLGSTCYNIFAEQFKPVERISALWREASSHSPVWQHRAEKNKFMLRGFRDLFIMEKR